jgi:hypothetical protein
MSESCPNSKGVSVLNLKITVNARRISDWQEYPHLSGIHILSVFYHYIPTQPLLSRPTIPTSAATSSNHGATGKSMLPP